MGMISCCVNSIIEEGNPQRLTEVALVVLDLPLLDNLPLSPFPSITGTRYHLTTQRIPLPLTLRICFRFYLCVFQARQGLVGRFPWWTGSLLQLVFVIILHHPLQFRFPILAGLPRSGTVSGCFWLW